MQGTDNCKLLLFGSCSAFITAYKQRVWCCAVLQGCALRHLGCSVRRGRADTPLLVRGAPGLVGSWAGMAPAVERCLGCLGCLAAGHPLADSPCLLPSHAAGRSACCCSGHSTALLLLLCRCRWVCQGCLGWPRHRLEQCQWRCCTVSACQLRCWSLLCLSGRWRCCCLQCTRVMRGVFPPWHQQHSRRPTGPRD